MKGRDQFKELYHDVPQEYEKSHKTFGQDLQSVGSGFEKRMDEIEI
jgi:hypothetical protein